MVRKKSDTVQMGLDEIIPYFAELEDPRSSVN